MDEDKPEHLPPHDGAPASQHPDNSLVSKLARAYSSLPAEQREASALPDGGDSIANPEAEDKFQKLLKQLEVLETYQGRRDHKPDPRVVALLEKKIERLRAQGGELSEDGASSESTPAEISSSIGSSVQCGKCGHSNSASTRFCGMCGAELLKSGSISRDGSASAAATVAPRLGPEAPILSAEPGAQGRSHRGLGIGFLVLLLAALALFALWRWPSWPQELLRITGRVQTPNPASVPSAAETPPPAPAEPPAKPPVAAEIPPPASPTLKPRAAAQSPARKPVPPTTIKQPLPGPVPLTSALPQTEAAPSTQPQPEAAQPAPQRTRLAPEVAQGELIYKLDPEYPQVARLARVQGAVVLHAIIGKDGTVQQLQVVRGNPLLAGPALNAVKNWRYRPHVVDGEAVEVETTITVNFKGED